MELLAGFPDGYTAVYNKKVVKNGVKEMIAMGDKLVAGETGPEAPSNWNVMFFKKFLNPDMKLIFGYDKYVARTAILRGETQMMHETSPLTITVWKQEPDIGVAFTSGQLDDAGNVVRDPLLPDVPTIIEIYQETKGRLPSTAELGAYKAYLGGGCGMGRGYWLPPGTSPEIVRAFRKAMADMVKDPGFIKAAGPRLEGFDPVVGEKADKLLQNTLGQPPEALAWLKNWLATDYNLK
jgi:tripartite-type tricarboxylate transporter receptor subunit TctC